MLDKAGHPSVSQRMLNFHIIVSCRIALRIRQTDRETDRKTLYWRHNHRCKDYTENQWRRQWARERETDPFLLVTKMSSRRRRARRLMTRRASSVRQLTTVLGVSWSTSTSISWRRRSPISQTDSDDWTHTPQAAQELIFATTERQRFVKPVAHGEIKLK